MKLSQYPLSQGLPGSMNAVFATMAWRGHQTLQEAERYTCAAQLKKLVMGDEHIENIVSLEIRDTKTAKA
ncbi:hypothetical protein [Rhodovulum sulfidophilum]|uniref:hypothetical protein n=1 Tax=Rhodovulum sulfidophilum TaxID=35806 RepID=UPI0009530002|nr:hypothetical protein [Rhodovulum sulfidophilum]MBL3552521.1 hypothetical protein [Rhodovulum sulfidophilum]OLS49953.1 hypothetical protein BV379_17835 [Rhodovulum sulfidophilum]